MAENGSFSLRARCFWSCIGFVRCFFIAPGPPF
jgi:hypothetical protein